MKSRTEMLSELKEEMAKRHGVFTLEERSMFEQLPWEEQTEIQEFLVIHNDRQARIRELTPEERKRRAEEVQELLGFHGPEESTRPLSRKEKTDQAMEEYGLVGFRKHWVCFLLAIMVIFGLHHHRE